MNNTIIRVNPLFFALFPAAAALGHLWVLLIVLASAFLHESAHLLAGLSFGLRPKSLDITPVGLAVGFPRIDYLTTCQKYALYLSGPAASLAAALGAFLADLSAAFYINMAFFAFNMLPVRSLDGGRALGVALARRVGFIRASKIMSRSGRIICALLTALGIIQAVLYFPNVTLLVISILLLASDKSQSRTECARFTSAILGKCDKYAPGRRLNPRTAAFSADAPAKALLDALDYDSLVTFYIYDETGDAVLLTERAFIAAVNERGASVAAKELLTCPADEGADRPRSRR